MDYEPVSSCRCCGSRALHSVLALGSQPLANSYTSEPADLPVYPLELLVCQVCFHNQLSVVVNPDLMFRNYLYVSGTSRTLRAHFSKLAQEAVQIVQPRPRKVLDLACNDCTLLKAFRQLGCIVRGVDPAANLARLAAAKGIKVVEGYWPEVRNQVDGPFDVITATNVLAHVANPQAFLEAALQALSGQGILILEFPYCREMILRHEWDTIYHEHLSYFLAGPILFLLRSLGATVIRARLVPIHGGSLRLIVMRSPHHDCRQILDLTEAEEKDGLYDLTTYQSFAKQVDSNCRDLREKVNSFVSAGRRVIGYGASAKGNTLLNRCPLPLKYIVDDNRLKHGYLTPGCQILIRPVEAVLTEEADLGIVLLAWNFAREIVANLRKLRAGCRDQVISYVPKVQCHAVDSDFSFLE